MPVIPIALLTVGEAIGVEKIMLNVRAAFFMVPVLIRVRMPV